jgi:hypothetical protein
MRPAGAADPLARAIARISAQVNISTSRGRKRQDPDRIAAARVLVRCHGSRARRSLVEQLKCNVGAGLHRLVVGTFDVELQITLFEADMSGLGRRRPMTFTAALGTALAMPSVAGRGRRAVIGLACLHWRRRRGRWLLLSDRNPRQYGKAGGRENDETHGSSFLLSNFA